MLLADEFWVIKMKALIILVFGLLVGCERQMESHQLQEFHHVNGLSFKIAGPFADIRETADGYLIHFASENTRQINELEVRYQAEKPINVEEKNIEGQVIYFREIISTEGSGGNEKILLLWKPIDKNKGIYVEHFRQSEYEFEFGTTWALMLSAR